MLPAASYKDCQINRHGVTYEMIKGIAIHYVAGANGAVSCAAYSREKLAMRRAQERMRRRRC